MTAKIPSEVKWKEGKTCATNGMRRENTVNLKKNFFLILIFFKFTPSQNVGEKRFMWKFAKSVFRGHGVYQKIPRWTLPKSTFPQIFFLVLSSPISIAGVLVGSLVSCSAYCTDPLEQGKHIGSISLLTVSRHQTISLVPACTSLTTSTYATDPS